MSRRFRAAALVAVTAALLLGLAPPASADDHDLVVVLDGPTDGQVLAGSTVTVTGRVEGRSGLDTVEGITVTLVRVGGGGPEPELLGNDKAAPEFAFRFRVPRNGQYKAVVDATGKRLLVADLKGSRSRTFGVAAPPRSPDDVKTEVSPEGAVTVSWARNVEPDILSYSVFRKDPGSDSYRLMGGPVEQPTSPRVSVSDPAPAVVGGDFTYRVVAVRQGATAGSRIPSDATTTEKVTLPTPPGGPAAPGGPGAGAGAGPGSGFLTGGFPAQPNGTAGGTQTFMAPDTGFSDELPFGARPPGEEMGEGPAEPRSLDVGTTRTEFVARGRPLVPVAGGAVLLLLAIHLRLMNKRLAASSPALVAGRADNDLVTADLSYGPYGGGSMRASAVPEVEPEVEPRPDEAPAPEPDQLYDWAQLQDEDLVDAVDDEWAGRHWDDHPDQDGDEVLESMVSPAR